MKKIKKLLTIFATVALVCIFVACDTGNTGEKSPFLGTWQTSKVPFIVEEWIFSSSTMLTIKRYECGKTIFSDSCTYTYYSRSNMLNVHSELYGKNEYTYEFKGNTLILTHIPNNDKIEIILTKK